MRVSCPVTIRLMDTPGFDYRKFPRRLNLGCGFDLRAGYLNVDFQASHKPDLVADVGKLQFLPADYYEEIVAQDVLEHLPRTSTRKILVHWNRLLVPGGLLRLRVPNALAILRLLSSRKNQAVAKQEELIQILFGTQAYSGDFHFTSFTEVLLRHYLQTSGFDVVSMGVPDPWNLDAVGRKVRSVDAHAVGDFSDLLGIAGDKAFVRECYLVILQRAEEAEGAHFWLSGLTEGRIDRQGVIDAMVQSDEFKALQRN
jgi:predicted SAM-dependent methyltransferase